MILIHCDQLINEAFDPSIPIRLIIKGLKALIHRYIELPSLSAKLSEFIKVLKHPAEHANEMWDAKLTKIINELKDEIHKIDIKLSKLNVNELDKEVPGLNVKELQKQYPDDFLDRIKYALHIGSIPSKFDSVTNVKALDINSVSDLLYYLQHEETSEIIKQINKGELEMFSNIGVKFTAHLDSIVAVLSRMSIPYVLEYFFGERVFNYLFEPKDTPISNVPMHQPEHIDPDYPYGIAAITAPLAAYSMYKYMKKAKKR